MLHEQRELYTKLTGEDANNISIGYLGAYLDGYERGKADMVAMLTELKTEIEEVEIFKNVIGWELTAKTPTNIKQDCIAIIQNKINELKAEDSLNHKFIPGIDDDVDDLPPIGGLHDW